MSNIKDNSVNGTRFKVNFNMQPIEGNTLENTEWSVKVFIEGSGKFVMISKSECKKVDANNYIIPIDSSMLGAGTYFITANVLIPDNDFADGFRHEVKTCSTGVTINAK